MAKLREHKGRSLLQFPDDFVIIDIETTGLDLKYNEIIEIAAIKIRDNQVVDTFDTLVIPNFELDDYISELTGITNKMLADAPDIQDVLPDFVEFVSNDILMGHNAHFDINFLYDNINSFLDINFTNNFVDTMRLSKRLIKDIDHHRLCDIAEYFGIVIEEAHRALADCYTTLMCYYKLREKVKELYRNEDDFVVKCGSFCKCDMKQIHTSNTEFDITHPLYQKNCVFTGTLMKLTRKEAAQTVLDLGGLCENRVTKHTNFLILGNNDYCSTVKGGKSTKQMKAERYKLEGVDIEIISENVFYEMLEMGGECDVE